METSCSSAPDPAAASSSATALEQAEARRRRRAERIIGGAESRLRRIEGVEEKRGDPSDLPSFAASAASAPDSIDAPAPTSTAPTTFPSEPPRTAASVAPAYYAGFAASPRLLHVGFTVATLVAGLLLWGDKRWLGATPLRDSMWPAFLAVNLLHLAVTMTGHLASMEAFCPGLLCQMLYCVAWLQPAVKPYAILLARMLGCLCFVVYLGAAYALVLLCADWLCCSTRPPAD